MNKEDNLKEKFKQALISTVKVISDDYKLEKEVNKNSSSKNYNFFELDNLNTKQDYIKLRAETDSEALKRKFSNIKTYQRNLPKNSSCKLLYDISEKIRYEILGTKMLKGISKNLRDNYSNKILLKRKDQLKTKDDVPIAEAFELYMLKNFLNIKLNSMSEKILSYWEKDFKLSFEKHINYLNKNIENQENFNSKLSEILGQMEIFDSEDDDKKEKNDENENLNNDNNDQDSQNQARDEQEKRKEEENQNGIDGDYDLNDSIMDEQLIDTDSSKQSDEKIIQKMNTNIGKIEVHESLSYSGKEQQKKMDNSNEFQRRLLASKYNDMNDTSTDGFE